MRQAKPRGSRLLDVRNAPTLGLDVGYGAVQAPIRTRAASCQLAIILLPIRHLEDPGNNLQWPIFSSRTFVRLLTLGGCVPPQPTTT